MDVGGNVDVWPGGLGIPARLVARPVTSTFPPPVYLWGHVGNREFHTGTCEYGRRIKNPARFPTWMRAVELGYNGCLYCQSEYDVAAVGQLLVDVAGAVSSVPEVTARLVSEVRRFGVIVRPPVERLDGRFGRQESTGSRVYRSAPLVPGTWEVIVTHQDWTVSMTVEVGRAWRSEGTWHGTATMVRAEVGSPEVGSETVPPRM